MKTFTFICPLSCVYLTRIYAFEKHNIRITLKIFRIKCVFNILRHQPIIISTEITTQKMCKHLKFIDNEMIKQPTENNNNIH